MYSFVPIGIPRIVEPCEVVDVEEMLCKQFGWTIVVHFSIERVRPMAFSFGLRKLIVSSTWSAVVATLRSSANPKMKAWG